MTIDDEKTEDHDMKSLLARHAVLQEKSMPTSVVTGKDESITFPIENGARQIVASHTRGELAVPRVWFALRRISDYRVSESRSLTAEEAREAAVTARQIADALERMADAIEHK